MNILKIKDVNIGSFSERNPIGLICKRVVVGDGMRVLLESIVKWTSVANVYSANFLDVTPQMLGLKDHVTLGAFIESIKEMSLFPVTSEEVIYVSLLHTFTGDSNLILTEDFSAASSLEVIPIRVYSIPGLSFKAGEGGTNLKYLNEVKFTNLDSINDTSIWTVKTSEDFFEKMRDRVQNYTTTNLKT